MHNSQKQSALLIEEKELQYVALEKGESTGLPIRICYRHKDADCANKSWPSRQAKLQLARLQGRGHRVSALGCR